jgi:hypothetical protein
LVSNDGRAWEISVPRKLDGTDATMGITETVAVITQILVEASLLPMTDAMHVIEQAYARGLPGKLTPGTTYDS